MRRIVFVLLGLLVATAVTWLARTALLGAQSSVNDNPQAATAMIYTFKSKAAGDVIMLGPNGDQVMTLLGRQPAAKGIFEVKDLPQLIQTLEAAVAAEGQPPTSATQGDDARDADQKARVALRARIWPLVEMMRRALAAREPIVWGV
jgi:hypothetical protein